MKDSKKVPQKLEPLGRREMAITHKIQNCFPFGLPSHILKKWDKMPKELLTKLLGNFFLSLESWPFSFEFRETRLPQKSKEARHDDLNGWAVSNLQIMLDLRDSENFRKIYHLREEAMVQPPQIFAQPLKQLPPEIFIQTPGQEKKYAVINPTSLLGQQMLMPYYLVDWIVLDEDFLDRRQFNLFFVPSPERKTWILNIYWKKGFWHGDLLTAEQSIVCCAAGAWVYSWTK